MTGHDVPARTAPQLVDLLKSAGEVGEIATLAIDRAVFPELLMLIVCELEPGRLWLAKTSFPVPASLSVCGEPDASSLTVRVPIQIPAALGVNVTEIVHVRPAASVAPHVVDFANTVVLTAILLIVRSVFPVFVRVNTCGELFVDGNWSVKVKPDGVSVSCGVSG